MFRRLCVLVCLLPGPAHAEPVTAHYAAYAAGLNVLTVNAQIDLTPLTYQIRVGYRTAGAVSLFVRSAVETVVSGAFVGGRAEPQHLASSGQLRGKNRITAIDYHGGDPVIRTLVPPVEQEREPVAPDLQRGTIDTLSAMAQLIEQVGRTGRCDGTVRTFDGRRLATLRAWTIGEETLPATSLSTYAGPALHCEFEGRQIGGFVLDEDRATLERPQRGGAWFATLTPGGPIVPVRVSFHTRWFGDATMYLTDGG